MNSGFERELMLRLDTLREQGLFRELREVSSPPTRLIEIEGKRLLNFASNDYLGLATAPELKEAALEAISRYGAGSTASRLVCGSLRPHQDLEQAIAGFKATPAAISFSSGYAAALGTICALFGKSDVIILDKLVHACIVDSARLSGAKLRVFAHNDLTELERILKWACSYRPCSEPPRILIATESVFSMDGDCAPLREIVALKERYGAWLMLDEAHATGLYGPNRRGLAEESGVSDRIEIQMGTLGKAIGSAGGYICGSRALIDFLVNRARTLIFSTAPVPAAAAAAAAGIRLVQSAQGEIRCKQLWQRVSEWRTTLGAPFCPRSSAIAPVMIGDEIEAVEVAVTLRQRGMLVPAIRYPSVARGQARLRITLSASHTHGDITALAGALQMALPIAQPLPMTRSPHMG
jgi:8-amino-7-oxononanoate synthase